MNPHLTLFIRTVFAWLLTLLPLLLNAPSPPGPFSISRVSTPLAKSPMTTCPLRFVDRPASFQPSGSAPVSKTKEKTSRPAIPLPPTSSPHRVWTPAPELVAFVVPPIRMSLPAPPSMLEPLAPVCCSVSLPAPPIRMS